MVLLKLLRNLKVYRYKNMYLYPSNTVVIKEFDKNSEINVRNQQKNSKENYYTSIKIPWKLFTIAAGLVFCKDYSTQDLDEKRFFKSCFFGLIHEVQKLIKAGIDVNKRHNLGWTPLLVATVNERYEIVECLLKAEADPNLSDNYINPTRTASEKGTHPIEAGGP